MHAVFLASCRFGIEHVDEFSEMFKVLRHLSGKDHVYHVVTNLLVRFAVEILEYVYAVIICKRQDYDLFDFYLSYKISKQLHRKK